MTIFRPRIGHSTFPGPLQPTCRDSARARCRAALQSAWFLGFAGKRISYGRIGPLSSLWGREKNKFEPLRQTKDLAAAHH